MSRSMTYTNEEIDHDWKPFAIGPQKVQACRRCGSVRRADDKNKPCKGNARVTVREK